MVRLMLCAEVLRISMIKSWRFGNIGLPVRNQVQKELEGQRLIAVASVGRLEVLTRLLDGGCDPNAVMDIGMSHPRTGEPIKSCALTVAVARRPSSSSSRTVRVSPATASPN